MTEIRMIVGLGNPGKGYTGTRHNAGFEVVDGLASQLQVEIKKKKFGGILGESNFDGTRLILLKPQRYMNRSGQVVATAAGFYRLSLENIIVITDDMALEPGRIRIRTKGSSGGHNGLGDIIDKIGTDQIARLRVGVGDSGPEVAEKYVLNKPSKEDRELIDKAVQRSRQAVICWITEGADAAMNKFNV